MPSASKPKAKRSALPGPRRARALLTRLDGSGSVAEWAAARELRRLGRGLPPLLLAHYRAARSWKVRVACVYHAVHLAQVSEAAVELGLAGLRDRARLVRYRAAMLLAYSQRRDLLAPLRRALREAGDRDAADLEAAIDAISRRNHHFYVDRDHTGQMFLEIPPVDDGG